MIRSIALMLSIAFVPGAFAQTALPCPWLTTGSAAKILGGDVTMLVRASGNFEGSCRFTRQTGEAMEALEILVGKADTHSCPEGSPKLKAIGNEAVQCKRSIATGQEIYTIAGRVRNVYFAVTLTNVAGAILDRSAEVRPADPYSASPLERLAEQVSGNLY
jgi:hypothetical protein